MNEEQDLPRYANPVFLDDFIGPLSDMGDRDEVPYDLVDPRTDDELLHIIEAYMLPYFRQTSPRVQRYAKATLRYLLSDRERRFDFKEYFESGYTPFNLSGDGRHFFELVWKVCFPGESYKILDLTEWTYSTNLKEVEELLRP